MLTKDFEIVVPMIKRERLTSGILLDRLQLKKQLPDPNGNDAVVLGIGKSQNRRRSWHADPLQTRKQ
jgi:hypothetical protein